MRLRACAIALATVDGESDNNYARALELTEAAARRGRELILLPEACAAGYCAEDLRAHAETVEDSRHLQAFARLSERHGCLIALGFIERGPELPANAVAIFERGRLAGVHRKTILWPDDARPWRDERRLMHPGDGFAPIATAFGRIGVLTCYENMVPQGWQALRGRVDLVLSPYNCEDDPSRHNLRGSGDLGVPSLWADRTGLTWTGPGRPLAPNPGTAGAADAQGRLLARSAPGEEAVVCVELDLAITPAVAG